MPDFSHLDANNNPSMVDVSGKAITQRRATAQAIVVLDDTILAHFTDNDIQTKKGAVFQTAILAGIMATKRTSDLIPLCHPMPLEKAHVHIYLNAHKEVVVECTAVVTAKTGVEMEALTGASVAALTVYDMCKAFSHQIEIKSIHLLSKTGGKQDFQRQAD